MNPVVRFAVRFSFLAIVFQCVYYAYIVPGSWFEGYLTANAHVASAVLRGLGERAPAVGTHLGLTPSVSLRYGCDGLQAIALFALGALSVPLGGRRKLVGVLVGIALLLALNVVRIVSLWWAVAYAPDRFRTLHVHVWPAVFIVGALLLWGLCLSWATKSTSS